jgi:FPC/CPF motif-containing protein YcgG
MSTKPRLAGLLIGATLIAVSACGGQSTQSEQVTSGEPSGAAQRPCGWATTYRSASEFEGLTQEQALGKASQNGVEARVVGSDGHCNAVQADYREDRLNFYVVQDRVLWAQYF